MKKITKIIVLAMLCPFFRSEANAMVIITGIIPKNSVHLNKDTIKVSQLKIGDNIPDLLWRTPLSVTNHPLGKKAITLQEYKGKVIILDFWATWCTACIGNFSTIEALALQFPKQLEILLVTNQGEELVKSFFSKRSSSKNNYSITNDKILKDLFPYQIIPHYVWISPNGVYLGATDVQDLTGNRIKEILRGDNSLKSIKKDMDTTIPLYSSPDLVEDKILHYSILVKGWNPGLPSGSYDIYKGDKIIGKSFTNASYYDIYFLLAYGLFALNGVPAHPSSLRFNIIDEQRFKSEFFNYEYRSSEGKSKNLYPEMISDLENHFPYKVEFKKELRPYLALINKPNCKTNKMAAPNLELKRILSHLNRISTLMPVLDETKLNEQFKGSLLKETTDLTKAKAELQSMGLDLILKYKEMYRFVLTEKVNETT